MDVEVGGWMILNAELIVAGFESSPPARYPSVSIACVHVRHSDEGGAYQNEQLSCFYILVFITITRTWKLVILVRVPIGGSSAYRWFMYGRWWND